MTEHYVLIEHSINEDEKMFPHLILDHGNWSFTTNELPHLDEIREDIWEQLLEYPETQHMVSTFQVTIRRINP